MGPPFAYDDNQHLIDLIMHRRCIFALIDEACKTNVQDGVLLQNLHAAFGTRVAPKSQEPIYKKGDQVVIK